MWNFVSIVVLVLQFGIINGGKARTSVSRARWSSDASKSQRWTRFVCPMGNFFFWMRIIWRKSSAKKKKNSWSGREKVKMNFHGKERRTKALYQCIYSIFQTETRYITSSEIKVYLILLLLLLSTCNMYSACECHCWCSLIEIYGLLDFNMLMDEMALSPNCAL